LLRHSTYTCLQCRQIADLNIALKKKTQQEYIVNNCLLRKAEANLQNSHVAEARLIDKVAAQRTVINDLHAEIAPLKGEVQDAKQEARHRCTIAAAAVEERKVNVPAAKDLRANEAVLQAEGSHRCLRHRLMQRYSKGVGHGNCARRQTFYKYLHAHVDALRVELECALNASGEHELRPLKPGHTCQFDDKTFELCRCFVHLEFPPQRLLPLPF